MKTVYRILAFDPATTEMGVAVLDYDITTKTATVLYTESLKGSSLLKEYKYLKPYFTKSFCIQTAYYHYIRHHLIPTWTPDFGVSEGAFLYRFVNAIISLTLVINAIRMAFRDALGRDITIVSPKETKVDVANFHEAKKEQMCTAVLNHPFIKFAPGFKNCEFLTEHEYDGIGHGYTFCNRKLAELIETKK